VAALLLKDTRVDNPLDDIARDPDLDRVTAP
jgi:hypothetical protein